MAQDTDATEKYSVATNSFWSNWFIQAGVEWNAWYGNYEDGKDGQRVLLRNSALILALLWL